MYSSSISPSPLVPNVPFTSFYAVTNPACFCCRTWQYKTDIMRAVQSSLLPLFSRCFHEWRAMSDTSWTTRAMNTFFLLNLLGINGMSVECKMSWVFVSLIYFLIPNSSSNNFWAPRCAGEYGARTRLIFRSIVVALDKKTYLKGN